MYRVTLPPAQRGELKRRTREPGLKPRTRDRLEMVRLSDSGMSIPQIARVMDTHEQTVRKYLKAFLSGGFEALPDRPHPGPVPKVTEEHLVALERQLDGSERVWTMPQLAHWLHTQQGVKVHPDHLRQVLQSRGFRWKRMTPSVAHKQDRAAVEAARKELDALKKAGPIRSP